MQQHMENYTPEDQLVWQTLFNRQINNLEDKGAKEYLTTLEKMHTVLNGNAVPDFDEINHWFKSQTGWKIAVVPGLIPVEDFFELLANKRFCSSTWLRTMHQLDYLEEPDMFHDIFGHIPLLANPVFSTFAQRFGQLGVLHKNDPIALKQLQRLYWFTIEFGVMETTEGIRSYGAGILSSFGETNRVAKGDCQFIPFDIDLVLNRAFRTDQLQEVYFKINSFTSLIKALETVDMYLSRKILI